MRDADVSILHEVEMPMPYDQMLRKLIDDTKWRQEKVRIYGKVYQQPRLIAWYGDPGKGYQYSGISLTPLPWTDLLREIKRRIEDCTDSTFNSVFLNFYRDQNDSMGFHSDDERELGAEPVIGSLTFGATRTFVLKHKHDSDLPPVKLALEAGSVLLMKGKTQRFWKHGILKQRERCGPRVNLTFRTIYQ
jgi:alkylated DNA repair dioxygenase AlkB